MAKDKKPKARVIPAYPGVGWFSDIRILNKERNIAIGGFTADGGFFLKEGYSIVKEKTTNLLGEELTYYNFVKDPKKKCRVEKELLKSAKKEQRYQKKREKELEQELKQIRKI